MAKFYGSLKGNRSEVTRCGSTNSGIKSSVQSWEGSIITELYEDTSGDIKVQISVASGSSARHGRILFAGKLQELVDADSLLVAKGDAVLERGAVSNG